LIIANDGSVKGIDDIPEKFQQLFKTVWEIKQQDLIDLAADRQDFIDQSQSFSAFIANPSYESLSQYHMATWKRGIKTGMYYLHMKPSTQGIKYTLEQQKEEKIKMEEDVWLPPNERTSVKKNNIQNTKECDENCDMCGS
jgi:ribonucleotide reductase alpha subunit